MKTLFSFSFILFMSMMTFAQEFATASKSELSAIKNDGKGTIVLPADVNAEEVAKASKYYTHYFAVSFNEETHEATIEMIENNAKSRIVIVRFLSACGVDTVDVEGERHEKMEVYEKFLK